jgi:hypothetical protein
MIKDKYVMPISIIAMLLSIVLILFFIFRPLADNTEMRQISQPDYISEVFDKNKVTEIDIQIDEDDWKWLIENARREEYKSCDITINGKTFHNVGIRPKGNSSLNMVASDSTTDRFSFKIKFDEYIEGQSYDGLKRLALNNIISDKTYMKEYLSYKLFEAMGIATPAYAYTHIKVNGQEWGLYLAVEVMEKSFLERYYDEAEGNLYKPESAGFGQRENPVGDKQKAQQIPDGAQNVVVKQRKNPGEMPADGKQNNLQKNPQMPNNEEEKRDRFGLMQGRAKGTSLIYNGDDLSDYSTLRSSAVLKTTDDDDFQKVIDMIKNLNQGKNLEESLDVDEILRYFAVNTFLVNLDSYAGGLKHNYYLYEENGVFQILSWDLNLSFAGHEIQNASRAINFPIDTPVSDSMENSPLIAKLLEVPEYKEQYHKYLDEIVTEYIKNGIFENTISKVDKLIQKYVKNDSTAFYSYDEYKSSLPVLIQFGKDRATSIDAQLSGKQPATSYGTIDTTVDLSALGGFRNIGGRPPGQDQNPNDMPQGASPQGEENMPDHDTMRQAMQIIQNANGNELSEEQLTKLKELGLDDAMLERLLSMPQRLQQDFENRPQMPDRAAGGPVDQRNQMQQTGSSYSLIALAISGIFLLAGTIFVTRFKRKKYHI